LYLSAFHIGPTTVHHYAQALNDFRPEIMTGYASANYYLARLLGEFGLRVHSPRAIIVFSDRLEPRMRATLESVFNTRVYEEYGAVENCGIATQCERERLHVSPDFGYVEILRPDGRPTDPEEVGEIVLTGFANTDQIFIRYRIGDLASWSRDVCPCGRDALPTIHRLVGRLEDTLITPDGREIMRNPDFVDHLSGVIEVQIIQESLCHFTVNVVPSPSYSVQDEKWIIRWFEERISPGLYIRIRKVHSLPRETNGKLKMVISNVKRRERLSPPSYEITEDHNSSTPQR
jgi:phenylacetate-CoA ligase